MRAYRYELADRDHDQANAIWIDLDHILWISDPLGINSMGHGGMFYGFAIKLAFQNEPLYIRHSIDHVHVDKETDPDTHEYQNTWCAREHPERYVDQTAQFKDRWQALYDAWTKK